MYAFVAKKEGKSALKNACFPKLSRGLRPESFILHYATATILVEPGPSRVDACLLKRSLCFGGSALLEIQAIVGSTAVVSFAFRAATLAAHCARHWAS